ncbi:MAG: hypothetical protein ACHQIM_07050 [Sphingobacteriales bacterium]
MTDFEIIDHKGRKFIVRPMAIERGFNLFDNMGYRHEVGLKLPANTWIKLGGDKRVTPFEYDVQEIGRLIENHYKN